MERYRIDGGVPLAGRVSVAGAKNAALKLMAAALLAPGTYRLAQTPQIADVGVFRQLLERLGVETAFAGDALTLEVPERLHPEAPYDLVRRMRASIIVLGPLLARCRSARVALPGGCNIGSRKIDLHLKGLERMGAEIASHHGYLEATAGRLHGAVLSLDFPSVGATENLLMAAVLAKGTSVIENAAREPEIRDLVVFLRAMGARIAGEGTPTIEVEGVETLHPADHTVLPDRIEAATYLIAAAATGGDVTVEGARAEHLELPLAKLADAGAELDATPGAAGTTPGAAGATPARGTVRIRMEGRPRAVDVVTLPYPGFPTDLQPQMMVLCTVAEGTSVVTENVFENRFMFVDELLRMGADIRTESHHAVIRGVRGLEGAPVRAPDIRAGAATVIAGLAAAGITEISPLDQIDRGYEGLEAKLAGLGARITREPA